MATAGNSSLLVLSSEIIARLQATEQEEKFVFGSVDGRRDGIEWAQNKATLSSLRKIAEAEPSYDWLSPTPDAAYSSGELFYFILDPTADRLDADRFWSLVVGDNWVEIVTDEYVTAFALGAIEVLHAFNSAIQ